MSVRKWKGGVIVLASALFVTNVVWAYRAVDHLTIDMYRQAECREHDEALAQALAIVRLAKGRKVRAEIVRAAREAAPQLGEPFEKDGMVIVGRLAFVFDGQGGLLEVRAP